MSKVVSSTTATNKKLREILTGIRKNTLIPNPEFQRRLVWTNKDKISFLKTVLEGYPFPEIYIAAGDVDPDTGEGTEMLVDGQQRMTTLLQYFVGSDELRLPVDVPPYSELDDIRKLEFLEYGVVVRDLGTISIDDIKKVFERINSTKYSLNAMEINNARYDGEFKQFAEDLATNSFFEDHRVFSAGDTRRMEDVRYTLTIIVTLLSTYFNRDNELENFLQKYNDEFPEKEALASEMEVVFDFINHCELPDNSRAWKKADLFTLIVEVYRAIITKGYRIDPVVFGARVSQFYSQMEQRLELTEEELAFPRDDLDLYAASIFQGTNDRTKRIDRGGIIETIIDSCRQN